MFKRYKALPGWLRWGLEILLVMFIIFVIRSYQSPTLESSTAPDFSGVTLAGDQVSLAGYAGEPLLLVVWAEWCHICSIELPMLTGLLDDHQVLTLAIQSGSDDQVRQFLYEQQLSHLPVLNDSNGELASALGVRGVPVMYIIDSSGQIRFTEVGLTSSWGLRARLWWVG
ncbi:redoxin domain-containing protein [Nitrincola iocasae]|uniref:Redoxin domain-containing protein n=1 Tax=Nitrincola iocasae TaxID=2614693 RepID=A0A5J6LFE9_9GAMM|nr:redoxin domain-containing protein [Nitrincola iocasae]QEW07287.1 redoxin domain-containing protein [Nitrincola iocasae]